MGSQLFVTVPVASVSTGLKVWSEEEDMLVSTPGWEGAETYPVLLPRLLIPLCAACSDLRLTSSQMRPMLAYCELTGCKNSDQGVCKVKQQWKIK